MAALPTCIRSVLMTVGPDIGNFQGFFKCLANQAQCFAAYLHIRADGSSLLFFSQFSNNFLAAFLLELMRLVQDNVF